MTDFETVQQGRHAVRGLLTEAYSAYADAGEEYEAEAVAQSALILAANHYLLGVVGLSQEEQVARLARAGRFLTTAQGLSTLETAAGPLTEASTLLSQAVETNQSVGSLAASRDFEAHQAVKAEKRAAEQADFKAWAEETEVQPEGDTPDW